MAASAIEEDPGPPLPEGHKPRPSQQCTKCCCALLIVVFQCLNLVVFAAMLLLPDNLIIPRQEEKATGGGSLLELDFSPGRGPHDHHQSRGSSHHDLVQIQSQKPIPLEWAAVTGFGDELGPDVESRSLRRGAPHALLADTSTIEPLELDGSEMYHEELPSEDELIAFAALQLRAEQQKFGETVDLLMDVRLQGNRVFCVRPKRYQSIVSRSSHSHYSDSILHSHRRCSTRHG